MTSSHRRRSCNRFLCSPTLFRHSLQMSSWIFCSVAHFQGYPRWPFMFIAICNVTTLHLLFADNLFHFFFFSQIYFCKSVIKYWPESSKLLIRCFCVTFWPPISIIYKSFYKFFCRNKMCLNFYDFLQRVLFQLHFHKSSHVSYMV